jgi:hypothetical protein
MLRDGWLPRVRVSSPLASSSLHILRDADEDLFAWDPDVIVLHTGVMEMLHQLIPRPIARHVFVRTSRPGRWRQIYRRRLLWPAYSLASRAQARLEPMLPATLFRRRRAAVVAHANQFITFANRNGYPLIIIMGHVPPAGEVLEKFPLLPERATLMNEALRAMVAERSDSDIIWFDTAAFLTEQGWSPEEALVDGIHFTAEVHEAVGRRLAEVVTGWARKQPHLSASSEQTHG